MPLGCRALPLRTEVRTVPSPGAISSPSERSACGERVERGALLSGAVCGALGLAEALGDRRHHLAAHATGPSSIIVENSREPSTSEVHFGLGGHGRRARAARLEQRHLAEAVAGPSFAPSPTAERDPSLSPSCDHEALVRRVRPGASARVPAGTVQLVGQRGDPRQVVASLQASRTAATCARVARPWRYGVHRRLLACHRMSSISDRRGRGATIYLRCGRWCSTPRGRRCGRRSSPSPSPAPGRSLLRVLACGVCRTDLHIVDGELTEPKLPLVLGHQVVGEVVGRGGRARSASRPATGSAFRGSAGPAASVATAARGGRTSAGAARFTGYDARRRLRRARGRRRALLPRRCPRRRRTPRPRRCSAPG